ncbi:DUF6338 family protein [Cellulomonas phragmiteti]|uniref:Uncharacterized protein n=1 Tax=Cellulomonas phragmiteti TaxID=478780 RepID=A0ABQ4DN25_9CELL|nr:DUF6338 family protein [Cellulomonas phragmiteti]GIG40738.1 hypothetical protein Cph01nite_25000 [Cellulomonas phragmiteti]
MDTVEALAVTLVAVLPGAVYTFAVERWTGAFGVSLSDRLVRFTAASAVFVAVFSGPAYILYQELVLTQRLATGDVHPLLLEGIALAYVLIPAGAGALVGWGRRCGWRWASAVVGEAPEPRAWDYLWRHGRQGLVRAKTVSGAWLGGMYGTLDDGTRSYAAGYPEEQDLYLAQQLQVDPLTGEWKTDSAGRPLSAGPTGLLLRWDQIEFIEFLEMKE